MRLSDYMKNQTRPDYWVPDEKSPNCKICSYHFGGELNPQRQSSKIQIDNYRHHCRACGDAICSLCSKRKAPVPDRGWFEDVRICERCYAERKPKDE